MLAEAEYADLTVPITLTYRGDVMNAYMLDHRDIKLWLKRFRKHGYSNGYTLRYFVSGEYGELKGRAHWHAILFLYGVTRLEQIGLPSEHAGKGVMYDGWPLWGPKSDAAPYLGHVHYSILREHNPRALYYAAKYASKSLADRPKGTERRRDFRTEPLKPILSSSRSMKPILGHAYFLRYAEHCVRLGHFPQHWTYIPRGAPRLKDGKPWKFRMTTAAQQRTFMEEFRRLWPEYWSGRPLPDVPEIEQYEDREARAWATSDPVELARQIERKLGLPPQTRKAFSTRCGRGVLTMDNYGTIHLVKLAEPHDVEAEIHLRREGATEAELRAYRKALQEARVVLPTFADRLRAARGDWRTADDLRRDYFPEGKESAVLNYLASQQVPRYSGGGPIAPDDPRAQTVRRFAAGSTAPEPTKKKRGRPPKKKLTPPASAEASTEIQIEGVSK